MTVNDDLQAGIDALVRLLNGRPGFCTLTGAGVSTESGLPAYRNTQGDWQHARPMEHSEFTGSESRRKVYWARSLRGWPAFSRARPNQTHRMLDQLQRRGYIDTIITQNVDRLHQTCGSHPVIDLHGRLDRVTCLECRQTVSRQVFQQRLLRHNQRFAAGPGTTRPDGDVDIDIAALDDFSIPQCEHCGGNLKPDVVFFGGTLNPQTANDSISAVEESSGLLVVGSSLMVYSGFRLVKRAVELGKPVIILNRGRTRADDLYTLKIDHESGQVLTRVWQALTASGFH